MNINIPTIELVVKKCQMCEHIKLVSKDQKICTQCLITANQFLVDARTREKLNLEPLDKVTSVGCIVCGEYDNIKTPTIICRKCVEAIVIPNRKMFLTLTKLNSL